MRVFLACPTFDLDGTAAIDPLGSSDFGEVRRRVNRVQTLDGGVAVNDGGTSDGDRTFAVAWRTGPLTREQRIERLVSTYSRLSVSTREGLFAVAPESYRRTAGESKLTLLVVERLA